MNMREFIYGMPKVELHRHLSGALSSTAMYNIAVEHGFSLDGKDLETFKKMTSMYGEEPDFHTFLDKFITRANFITDRAFIGEIVRNVVSQKKRYTKTSLQLMMEKQNLHTLKDIMLKT